jgi:hypothetical protein
MCAAWKWSKAIASKRRCGGLVAVRDLSGNIWVYLKIGPQAGAASIHKAAWDALVRAPRNQFKAGAQSSGLMQPRTKAGDGNCAMSPALLVAEACGLSLGWRDYRQAA